MSHTHEEADLNHPQPWLPLPRRLVLELKDNQREGREQQRERAVQDMATYMLVLDQLRLGQPVYSLRRLQSLTGVGISRAKKLRDEAETFWKGWVSQYGSPAPDPSFRYPWSDDF